MRLRWVPSSPFARKVTVVLHETGLIDRVELVAADPYTPAADLTRENPLGKVPALIVEGGEVLFDSPVICEYLDGLHDGTPIFPPAGGARWTALRRQAQADGILDAAVLLRFEDAFRPAEFRWEGWRERQINAIGRALDAFEDEADTLGGAPGEEIAIGHIALGCALGYLEFRYGELNVLAERPALADWWDAFSSRPSMVATEPRDPKT